MKQAQTTIFFMIGLALLIIFGIVQIMNKGDQESNLIVEQPLAVDPVVPFVETCLKDALLHGLYYVSSRGGFYTQHEDKHFFEGIAVYVSDDSFSVPSLYDIENELASFVEEQLPFCLDNFADFTSLGYEIETESQDAKVTIRENRVGVFLSYPLAIKKGKAEKHVEEFEVGIPADFANIYRIVQELMIQQGEDPYSVHISFLAASAVENSYFFRVMHIGENDILYSLSFDSFLEQDKPFLFNFAATYSSIPLELEE